MADGNSTVRILGIVVIVVGVVFAIAGMATWLAVSAQLEDENITVSDDAGRFAGQSVTGPLTAYEQANVIKAHALEATSGKTYAEIDREDPARQTAMTASFLRSSLYTSVVSFGVAAMAIGLGVALVLMGWALVIVGRGARVSSPSAGAAAEPSPA